MHVEFSVQSLNLHHKLWRSTAAIMWCLFSLTRHGLLGSVM